MLSRGKAALVSGEGLWARIPLPCRRAPVPRRASAPCGRLTGYRAATQPARPSTAVAAPHMATAPLVGRESSGAQGWFPMCKLILKGFLMPRLLMPEMGRVEFAERFAPAHDALSSDKPRHIGVAFAESSSRRRASLAHRLSPMLVQATAAA
jgi:hypothetical protein